MAIRKWVNLKFNTSKGKVETIKVCDVKENISANNIKVAMTKLVESNVFKHSTRGRLISINNADIITQEERQLKL